MGMQAKIRIRWATTGWRVCILIIFLDSFCSVSSMDGNNMTMGEDDFDVILD